MFLSLSLLWLFSQQAPQTDAERLTALQLSRECSDAGDAFVRRRNFTSTDQTTLDHVTHYNREENKCFVEVISMPRNPAPGSVSVRTIYDAGDGVPFASASFRGDGQGSWYAYEFTGPVYILNGDEATKLKWFTDLMRN